MSPGLVAGVGFAAGIVAVLVAFFLYLRRFFEPMQELSQFYNLFQAAAASLEKLSGVLDEAPSVGEPDKPVPLTNRSVPPGRTEPAA